MSEFEAFIQEKINHGLIDFKVAIGNSQVSVRQVEDCIMAMDRAFSNKLVVDLPLHGREAHPEAKRIAQDFF